MMFSSHTLITTDGLRWARMGADHKLFRFLILDFRIKNAKRSTKLKEEDDPLEIATLQQAR